MEQAFRQCLEEGDYSVLDSLWRHHFPHLEQAKNDFERKVVLHRARTEAQFLPLEKRLYSHSWLRERGVPSALPYELRPPGERDKPIIASAVGIIVRARSPEREELAAAVEKAMSDAVLECYADGRTDARYVSTRMWEARDRLLKKLN